MWMLLLNLSNKCCLSTPLHLLSRTVQRSHRIKWHLQANRSLWWNVWLKTEIEKWMNCHFKRILQRKNTPKPAVDLFVCIASLNGRSKCIENIETARQIDSWRIESSKWETIWRVLLFILVAIAYNVFNIFEDCCVYLIPSLSLYVRHVCIRTYVAYTNVIFSLINIIFTFILYIHSLGTCSMPNVNDNTINNSITLLVAVNWTRTHTLRYAPRLLSPWNLFTAHILLVLLLYWHISISLFGGFCFSSN